MISSPVECLSSASSSDYNLPLLFDNVQTLPVSQIASQFHWALKHRYERDVFVNIVAFLDQMAEMSLLSNDIRRLIEEEICSWGNYDALEIAFESKLLNDINFVIQNLWAKSHFVTTVKFIKHLMNVEDFIHPLKLHPSLLRSLDLKTLVRLVCKGNVDASFIAVNLPNRFLDSDFFVHSSQFELETIFLDAVYKNNKELLKNINERQIPIAKELIDRAIAMSKVDRNHKLTKILQSWK